MCYIPFDGEKKDNKYLTKKMILNILYITTVH